MKIRCVCRPLVGAQELQDTLVHFPGLKPGAIIFRLFAAGTAVVLRSDFRPAAMLENFVHKGRGTGDWQLDSCEQFQHCVAIATFNRRGEVVGEFRDA